MKKCKYCGREIGKDTNFCWYCGRELEARPERPEVHSPESRPQSLAADSGWRSLSSSS